MGRLGRVQGVICTGDSGDHIGFPWIVRRLLGPDRPGSQAVRRPSALICQVLRAMVAWMAHNTGSSGKTEGSQSGF